LTDALISEILKQPQTWAVVIAVLGLIGSWRVIDRLITLVRNRESSNERLLNRIEEIAECQTRLVSSVGATYTKVLELTQELENANRDPKRKPWVSSIG
jgi:hypothetical protein